VGEKITWTSAPASLTLSTTEADWTNASIALTAGTWQIYANVQVYVETGATAGNFSSAGVRITDASNNIVQEMDQQFTVRTPANAINVSVGTLAFSFVANLSTSTTYKIRARRTDGVGTGVATIYNQASNRSQFFAVRIA
jgi:hypothetical protein